jgi:hypothetical protein
MQQRPSKLKISPQSHKDTKVKPTKATKVFVKLSSDRCRGYNTDSKNTLKEFCMVGRKPTIANLDINGFYLKLHVLVGCKQI